MTYEEGFTSGLITIDTHGMWTAFTGRRDMGCAEVYREAYGTVPHAGAMHRMECYDAGYEARWD